MSTIYIMWLRQLKRYIRSRSRIIGALVLFTSMFNGVEMIWDRQFGFLKETMVAPVSRFNIMFGRVLGGATVATIQGLIVFILSFGAGFRLHMSNPAGYVLLAIIFMFLIALFFTALGTGIASMLTDFQGFQLMTNLPPVMEFITRIDPLTYGVDGLRGSLIAGNTYALGLDFLILLVLSAVMLSICSFLFSKIEV
jgi:ABC-2 type transport system permease protein